MRAFSEKADFILRTLNTTSTCLSWDKFALVMKLAPEDAILVFLKNKGLIEYSDKVIKITSVGSEFINSTSFVQQST